MFPVNSEKCISRITNEPQLSFENNILFIRIHFHEKQKNTMILKEQVNLIFYVN